MLISRAAAIPLITHDPYFSIWSGAGHPSDKDPIHWSGLPQCLRGRLSIGQRTWSFLGEPQGLPKLPLISTNVTATSTTFCFDAEGLQLTVRFVSPLIASDLLLLSRPCTYIDAFLSLPEGASVPEEKISLTLYMGSTIVSTDNSLLIGLSGSYPSEEITLPSPISRTVSTAAYQYAMFGRAFQKPLGHSGDNHTIDYGYAYLASADPEACLSFCADNQRIVFTEAFDPAGLQKGEAAVHLMAAYDDTVSINYFGEWCRGYWTRTYGTIEKAIGAAIADKNLILKLCQDQDQRVEKAALASGGEDYAFLCIMAYRHTLCAHKLVLTSGGELAFLSKENDSNGCIGTVDVSYPSTPLLLLENPDLVKGLVNPVFRFAACPVWEYDFAPHDVGRYPYAWGQVYGVNPEHHKLSFAHAEGAVYPPFYQYPAGLETYSLRGQMPVEECGNMLIMTAAVCLKEKSAEFALPHMETLRTWTGYLLTYGEDPGEQLCTDDFAGHLAHNVNLSAKAIMGIEAYSQILRMMGDGPQADEYHQKAAAMAKSLKKRAFAGDHYTLVYPSPERSPEETAATWSLKYNMVWDRLFGSGLFGEEVFETETDTYIRKMNAFGTPLDNRSTYTKSDWILWSVALTDDIEKRKALISPVAKFERETPSRYPFSDWYFTDTGRFRAFKGRSVQGGIYMPILVDQGL